MKKNHLIMKISKIYPVPITIIFLVIMFSCSVKNNADPQLAEATGVIKRVLPGYADQFILKLIDKEGDKDVFEIEASERKDNHKWLIRNCPLQRVQLLSEKLLQFVIQLEMRK